MIKAVFFDIDGTLLDHDHGSVMPPSTLASLKALRKRGVKLYIASGRDASMLGAVRDIFPFDGYIASNGQNILDGTGPYPTPTHRQEDILGLLELAKDHWMSIMISEREDIFPAADDEPNRRMYRWLGREMPPLYDPARLGEHPVVQFTVCLSPGVVSGPQGQELMDRGRELLKGLSGVEVTSAGGGILDCIPKGGGKEKGIALVCERLGIRREDTMVFGDGPNDARMLRWAGVGVAMGNGSPTAKEAADYVTTHVGKDGVKNALLHFGVLREEDFVKK